MESYVFLSIYKGVYNDIYNDVYNVNNDKRKGNYHTIQRDTSNK